VGLGIDEPVWVPTVFSKNRDRLLTTDIARKLMAAILANERVAPLLSDDHFSVDGTLVEAWASFKSFRPKQSETGAAPPDEPPPSPAAPPGAAQAESPSNTGKTATTGDDDTMTNTTKTTETAGRNVERDFRGHAW
jgi:hypothetical protein